MGASIAATAFITFALVAAYFLRPKFAEDPATRRGFLFWFAVTPFLYFIYPMLGGLIAAALLLAFLAPKSIDERAAYYLIALFAVPSGIRSDIPFPGINYLVVVDFPMIAGLVLLAPALVMRGRPNAARHAPLAGALILVFTALISAQEFRTENITNGLRGVLDSVLLYALPFMAIIRLAPSLDRFDKIFSAFLILAVIYACLAFASEATRWNFYTFLTERHGARAFADTRQDILRISVTVIPVLVGYVATLGFLAVEYFRARGRCGALLAWLYRALFVLTAVLTFSRGAWLAMAAGLMTYYFFTKFPRAIRPPAMILIAVFAVPAALTYVLEADLDRFDPYGTFEYRRDLLNTSIEHIRRYPLLGDPDYRESPDFAHLLQGQGIIDIVNHYLHIALEHGLLGLALYVGPFLIALAGLLGLGGRLRARKDAGLEQQRAVLIAGLIAYLVLIATVSGVSLVLHTGVIMAALSTAFLAAARKELAAPDARGGSAAMGFDRDGEGGSHRAILPASTTGDLFD